MAVRWTRKQLDKEVHPLALQKTQRTINFSSFVQVREFAREEQHPKAVFKTQQPSPPPTHAALHDKQEQRNHSILHVRSDSGDSSFSACADGLWEEELVLDTQKRLTISEEGKESLSQDYDAQNVYSDDDLEVNYNGQDIYKDGSSKLKDEGEESCSHITAASFKIKWSLKRKRKKKLRIKTPQRPRKVLLLGNINCGKSNLITTYCNDRFLESYLPTILHCCYSEAKVLGRKFDLILADTSGRDDFKPLRRCAYFKTDIAILCYSACDRSSLEEVRSRWLPELKANAPNCPFIIAETKKDTRDEQEDKKLQLEREGRTESSEYRRVMDGVVPEGAGARMSRELGAHGFYSTSAKYRQGTRALFQAATVAAVKKSRRFRD